MVIILAIACIILSMIVVYGWITVKAVMNEVYKERYITVQEAYILSLNTRAAIANKIYKTDDDLYIMQQICKKENIGKTFKELFTYYFE